MASQNFDSISVQVHSRILLAVGGIVVVVSSVVCSLGIFGYVGLATTMLTIEVIPFLVLAVGVDNLFILVHTFNRLDKRKYTSVSESVADALGQVGPSILLTSMSEGACFAIGSVTDMPAVKVNQQIFQNIFQFRYSHPLFQFHRLLHSTQRWRLSSISFCKLPLSSH